MDKFYTVFVSSTFLDLEKERETASKALMEVDCFPAGMELFPAADIQQFDYIKTIIDVCDYYVLIIGRRYGSISEDGLSYTEKEYDYAVEKGIPVLAFLHKSPEKISAENSELSPEARDKLEAFKVKAGNGRLVRFWNNKDELSAQVITAISRAKKMCPAIGWVRSNITSSVESLEEINDLRKQNDTLTLALKKATDSLPELNSNHSKFAKLSSTYEVKIISSGFMKGSYLCKATWLELLSTLSELVFLPLSLESVRENILKACIPRLPEDLKGNINTYSSKLEVTDDSFNKIKLQFYALGFIYFAVDNDEYGNPFDVWMATEKGKSAILDLIAIRD
jgi:Domain of unknown function (DUF4062)